MTDLAFTRRDRPGRARAVGRREPRSSWSTRRSTASRSSTPSSTRSSTRCSTRRATTPRGDAARRPVPRRPDRAQGPRRRVAGDPLHHGERAPEGRGSRRDHDSYLFAKLARRRVRHRRQDEHARVRAHADDRARGVRPDPQPVEHRRTRRRLERRFGAPRSRAGMVPVGHAGDGGGSIRIPASVCGLFGLKPSRGRVSLGPDDGRVAGPDSCMRHVVTRSVRDSAAVLDVLEGDMPGDPYTAPPPGAPVPRRGRRRPRAACASGCARRRPRRSAETDPDCVAAAEDAGRAARVARPPRRARVARRPSTRPSCSSSSLDRAHDARRAATSTTWPTRVGREVTADDVEPLTWAHTSRGRRTPRSQYLEAVNAAHAWTPAASRPGGRRRGRLRPAAHADAGRAAAARSATSSARRDDPLRGTGARARRSRAFTAPFNMTGQPAMSLPLYWEATRDLPIGVQLVAAHGREDLLLRVAAQLEPRGRGPTGGRRARVTGRRVTVRIAGGQGFYGDTPRRGRRPARRRRRLPLPRGARRADARDPPEGPPDATRRAATRATCRAYLARGAAGRRRRAARRSSPTRAASTRPRRRGPRSTPRKSLGITGITDRDRARRRPHDRGSTSCTRRRRRSRTSTPARRSTSSRRRRCSRPRTSARARSSTRSHRAPTS